MDKYEGKSFSIGSRHMRMDGFAIRKELYYK